MGSFNRLFNRQRTVHEIFGGGLVADVMLWRRGNLTTMILLATLAAWVVFEKSGHTLLSLVSNVLLLLIVILFLWAKSAAILNRPAPPLPRLYISEETVNEIGALIRSGVNDFLSGSQDIALGKDARLFFKVAAYLLLISVVGSLTDFLTLAYTSKFSSSFTSLGCGDRVCILILCIFLVTGLLVVLTVPALYERYEDCIDPYTILGCRGMQQVYVKFDSKFVNRFRKWILERQKLT